MTEFSTTAITLRRLEYGERDLILTLFTPDQGKISVIAKSAKKSVKRFGGALELFSETAVVCKNGRGKLPLLQEASVKEPFYAIRSDFRKTAYASYWAEIVREWIEEGGKEAALYELLVRVLGRLDQGAFSPEMLSVLFQMRFLVISGFCPDLCQCRKCKQTTEAIPAQRIAFDLPKGGLVCTGCGQDSGKRAIWLSKGTLKQLLWLAQADLEKAARIRFNPQSLAEALAFLEAFLPFHLHKTPKSLRFLRGMRGEAG